MSLKKANYAEVMYSASNSIALTSGLGNSIEKFSQFQNRLLCSPLLLRRSYHAFYFFHPCYDSLFLKSPGEFSFKDNSKNSVYSKSWFCFNGFAVVIAGVLADLDPPRIGPPGPNPLADLDPPPRIWTPYQNSVKTLLT